MVMDADKTIKEERNALTILVVDDDINMAVVVSEFLKENDYNVLIANTAMECIEILENEAISLILLDIILPDINGFELCYHIKKEKQYNHIPIMIFTVIDDLNGKVRGFEVGADDYLGKNENPLELIARVQALLRLGDIQNRLIQAEQRFHSIVECTNDAIIETDVKGKIVFVNIATSRLFGISRDEIIGSYLNSWFKLVDSDISIFQLLKKEKIENYEITFLYYEKQYEVLISITPLKNQNKLEKYIIIIKDMSDLHLLQQQTQLVNKVHRIIACSLINKTDYQAIAEELQKIIKFDRMSIALITGNGKSYELLAIYGDYDLREIWKQTYPLDKNSVLETIVNTKKPIIIKDGEYSIYTTHTTLSKKQINSGISYPLIYKDKVIGALNLSSYQKRAFSFNHLDILKQIASPLAVALENNRLMKQLEISQHTYHNLFRLAKDGMLLINKDDLRIMDANIEAEYFLGASLEELNQKSLSEIFNGIDKQLIPFEQLSNSEHIILDIHTQEKQLPLNAICRPIDYKGTKAIWCILKKD